jgi:hypothetical protein
VLGKIQVVSLAVVAFVVTQSINAFAIEPPNMKRITDEDKVYFGTRLDKEQIEKLQKVINHSKMSKLPCEKAVEIKKTLRFLKEVTPIFQEASTCTDVSSYARKYSASLTQELNGTSKVLNEMLPHYKKACAAGDTSQKEAGTRLFGIAGHADQREGLPH